MSSQTKDGLWQVFLPDGVDADKWAENLKIRDFHAEPGFNAPLGAFALLFPTKGEADEAEKLFAWALK